jgi:cation:H+ antiporter
MGEQALQAGSPYTVLWAAPAILLASLMIAWAAEASQYFLAQGIALALLALLQTLPEFAVEAVLAWHRAVPFLFANLTGSLMLLTGFGWPMIYFSAATSYRRTHKQPMRRIRLENQQSVQVFALLAGIGYQAIVWWKGSLTVLDSGVLLAIYGGFLWIMRRLPPEKAEEEVRGVPGAIIRAAVPARLTAILGLFLVGGAAVFLVADPFLRSIFGLATLLGVSSYQFIQWIAPLVSEAPEGISAFYWARDPGRAPIALMNLVSSNINQWTLLAAMLPIVLSVSSGQAAGIPLDAEQSRDVLLTLSQSLLGAILLINMELAWWEAAGLFLLFIVQLGFASLHVYITWIDFAWCGAELLRLIISERKVAAFRHFREVLSARGK